MIARHLSLLILLILSGCALKVGKSQKGVVDVLYSSPDYALPYYLLTIKENFDLEVNKNTRVLERDSKNLMSLLRVKKRHYADGYTKRRLKGDFVLLLDCKTFYTRREIQYVSNISETLTCPKSSTTD